MIKIDNMENIPNIIKNYNKIILKISIVNNFKNLEFYNFFVPSSDFGCIQEKISTIYLLHY